VRILGVTRLSRDSDASTSIERQRDAIGHTVKARGDRLVAMTEDVDTSGSVSPFERDDLGLWLTDPAKIGQWDALAVHKLDRLTRSLVDFIALLDWCKAHGKTVISVSESLDFSTAHGRMFAQLLAMFAEFERSRISERRADHARKARELARWDGRSIPTGYQPVKVNNHHELEPEPVAAALIHQMADMVIAGTSARQIAAALNAEGVPTIRGGRRWDSGVILRVMRNPSLRGYIMHDNEVVRGEDGLPVGRTPILDDDTWAKVQARLNANGAPGAGVRKGAAMLLGIIHCAECGQRLYIRRRSQGDRYRHPDLSTCTYTYTAKDVERETRNLLLAHTDELPMMERREVPAEDHVAELGRVQESLDELDQAFERGTVSAESYGRMTARLEAKRDHLASLPVIEAEEVWEQTDESFHDHWRSLDAAGQHKLLLDLGVRVYIAKVASGILVPDPPLRKGRPDGSRTTRVGTAVIKVDLGKISHLRKRAESARPGPMLTSATSSVRAAGSPPR
jgi:DNA invertase Pin-like site-specific DNA recombinase